MTDPTIARHPGRFAVMTAGAAGGSKSRDRLLVEPIDGLPGLTFLFVDLVRRIAKLCNF
jgi:hypothetical protein